MARGQPFGDKGGTGGQGQRRLGDVVAGIGLDLGAEGLDLFLGGSGTNQHPIVARSVDLFHDKVGQVFHDISVIVVLPQRPGLDVLQQRLLSQIEADHFRHKGIDRLVVGHARARGRTDRHPARAIDIHQPRNAQHRIGAEAQRIQEGIVDPAIDHIDAPWPLGGAHIDEFAVDEQIRAFDQFDAHQVGQESVFVIGAVEMARRQDHAGRTVVAFGGRHRFQRAAQKVGILVHGFDPVAAEQARKHPHHDLAVFQHIADPGRGAAVVLEDIELVLGGAHQVDADDMGINAARRHHAHHGLFIGVVLVNQPGGNAARAHDLGPAIDIAQKCVQRPRALLDAAFQAAPFGLFENARHHVKGDQPVGIAPLAIDGEGDADAAEQGLGLGLLHLPEIRRHCFDPLAQPCIGFANLRSLEHLVVIGHVFTR